jgi:NAD(P)-dependent dehydrogenase (short-subunit alcohol dehydrogenase family)
MKVSLKPLGEQVVVITGASSGIGRVTAREAARRGARVVLVSRDDADLRTVVDEIRAAGGRATHVVADVADRAALERAAEVARETFGGLDTWVNNAGVSVYGRLEEVSEEDARRVFETNYWGVVHGSLVAARHLRARGGALVNIGSVLSDTGYPLQGHYAASKHAVKAFTDALRMELEKDGAPVSVTLVKPGPIDTPYIDHARSYLDEAPTHMPPVYAPELVADAVLRCAERPARDVKVGGAVKLFTTMETFAPRLADRFKEATAFAGQRSGRPPRRTDTLHAPRAGDNRERGPYEGRVLERSLYTTATLNPVATVLGAAALGLGVARASRARGGT